MSKSESVGIQQRSLEVPLRKVRHEQGNCYVFAIPKRFARPDGDEPGEAPFNVYEDGKRLGPASSPHATIRDRGLGRFSVWSDPTSSQVTLFFSTSDNTPPRTNGRTYTLVEKPLSPHRARRRGKVPDDRTRWLRHPNGEMFLARGGNKVAPPLCANFGITDICNLKCSICGSQNMEHAINRRYMDFSLFSMAAETLFPLIELIEFNSRGEPMLHPRFHDMLEIVNSYGLRTNLQTNGTRFTEENLTNLERMRGTISISIDATGELFEYARAGGKWPQVDAGVRRLMAVRNVEDLRVSIYPTLTGKTIQGARELIEWAEDVGVERVDFHSYAPIQNGPEQAPSRADLESLRAFAAGLPGGEGAHVYVDYSQVRVGAPLPSDHELAGTPPNMPRPASDSGAHPDYTCMAPLQLVDIDLDGGVCVCCMLQSHKLGNCLTAEAFADCWFGAGYRALRESLRRPAKNPTYGECRACIAMYAS